MAELQLPNVFWKNRKYINQKFEVKLNRVVSGQTLVRSYQRVRHRSNFSVSTAKVPAIEDHVGASVMEVSKQCVHSVLRRDQSMRRKAKLT